MHPKLFSYAVVPGDQGHAGSAAKAEVLNKSSVPNNILAVFSNLSTRYTPGKLRASYWLNINYEAMAKNNHASQGFFVFAPNMIFCKNHTENRGKK